MNRYSSHIITAIASSVITLVLVLTFGAELVTRINSSGDSQQTPSILEPTPNTPADNTGPQYLQQIEELQLEIAWLQSVIEQLDDRPSAEADTPKPERRPVRFSQPEMQELWFDETSLLDAGLEPKDFEQLKQRFEQNELDKLELINRATREGWAGKSRFFKAMMQQEQQFKQSLTTDEYDIVLYASGRPNRIEVTDVLERSAANMAGIRAGDVILSYAGTPISHQHDLQQLTTQGDEGEMVPVRVLRDQEVVTTYVPRGVLGTRFKPVRRSPTSR